ncbi:MAG: universal stress protein [Thermodesulfobacteriota bacterium]
MSFQHIAFCTDFSKNADLAFETAVEVAEKFRAKLHILHVVPPVVNPLFTDFDGVTYSQPDPSLFVKIEEKMEGQYGTRIAEPLEYGLTVLEGHVSTEILRFIDENRIDLVVMGAFGLAGMGLVVFGSVAKRVSHKASCSVMIVRNPARNTDS